MPADRTGVPRTLTLLELSLNLTAGHRTEYHDSDNLSDVVSLRLYFSQVAIHDNDAGHTDDDDDEKAKTTHLTPQSSTA